LNQARESHTVTFVTHLHKRARVREFGTRSGRRGALQRDLWRDPARHRRAGAAAGRRRRRLPQPWSGTTLRRIGMNQWGPIEDNRPNGKSSNGRQISAVLARRRSRRCRRAARASMATSRPSSCRQRWSRSWARCRGRAFAAGLQRDLRDAHARGPPSVVVVFGAVVVA
jgi:hypothetical protein